MQCFHVGIKIYFKILKTNIMEKKNKKRLNEERITNSSLLVREYTCFKKVLTSEIEFASAIEQFKLSMCKYICMRDACICVNIFWYINCSCRLPPCTVYIVIFFMHIYAECLFGGISG